MSAPHGLPTPEALAAWLPQQRWFGAKSRRIGAVSVADMVPVGPGALLLADVRLDDGGRERYAVPLLAGGEIRDALGDVTFCRALVTLLARAGTVAGAHGEVRGVPAASSAGRAGRRRI
jgi:hypothetical protein